MDLDDSVSAGYGLLISGLTGVGKSWLACALAQYAFRQFTRLPRAQEELRIRHGSRHFGEWLLQLAISNFLVLDRSGIGAIDGMARSDLREMTDDEAGSKATIITSKLPVEHCDA